MVFLAESDSNMKHSSRWDTKIDEMCDAIAYKYFMLKNELC